MPKAEKVSHILYGGCVCCTIISLFGISIYAIIYSGQKENKWDLYYPGRQGSIGAVTIALAILPLFSLAFLLFAFFFGLCKCKCCCMCKCFKVIMGLVGFILFLAVLIIEVICVLYGGFNSVKAIYAFADDNEKFQEYVKNSKGKKFPSDISGIKFYPKKFAYYKKNPLSQASEIVSEYIKDGEVEVCYFDTQEQANNYEPVACIGSWSGKLLKSYNEQKVEQKRKEDEMEKSWKYWDRIAENYKDKHDQVLYNHVSWIDPNTAAIFPMYPVLQQMCGMMIGINIFAVIFYIIHRITKCCIKKKKNEQESTD